MANQEKSENLAQAVVEEKATEEAAEGMEEEENGEDAGELPFPRATIVNQLRQHLGKGKQIKGQVKTELNLWLAKLIDKIGQKMNDEPYTYVDYVMLKKSVAPYENIADINNERKSIMDYLENIKASCDKLITHIDEVSMKKVKEIYTEGEELPFPRATIVNKLREGLGEKQIKSSVKDGLNVWLGKMVKRIATKLNSYNYNYVDGSMFREAIEPYENVADIEKEKERIIKQLESIKAACDVLLSEVDRKFRI